jgi:hypothetical protein
MSDLLNFILNSKEELNRKLAEDIENWLYYVLNKIYNIEQVRSIGIGFLNPKNSIEPILVIGSGEPVFHLEKEKKPDMSHHDLNYTAIKSGENQINSDGKFLTIPFKDPKGEIIGIFNILSNSKKYFNRDNINKLNKIVEEITPLLSKMYIND